MRKALVLKGICSLLFVFALVSCAPAQYSAADLARLGAKTVEGVVTKQSRGSFVLKDGSGTEKTYRTGQLTQYIPVDYHSQQGDKVRVVFQESWERSGDMKLAVLQLAAVKVAEQNRQLPNPIEGKVVAAGRGSSRYTASLLLKMPGRQNALPIYVSSKTKFEVHGGLKTLEPINGYLYAADNFDVNTIVGEKARVTAKRIAILRGNAYIYVAERVVVN